MKFKYSAIAIALLSANYAFANQVQELNTSEVTAKADTSAIEVSSHELEVRQVNDIKGALNQIAGVSVSNGVRYSQKTYIRGVEEHAANITIDGVRQDGQMFHHAGNQFLDTSMLKAVSVELGATSVLSGYGANTGAIKYETKDPSDLLSENQRFGGSVGVSADDATEFRQVNVSAYGKVSDKFSLLGMFTKNDNGDIESPDADPIVNKHSELKSSLVKAVYDIDAHQQIKLNLQRVEDGGNRTLSGEKPGKSVIEQEELYNGYDRETYSIVYTNNSENPLLNLYINAYSNEKKMERESSTGSNWVYDPVAGWQVDGTQYNPAREYIYETVGLDVRNESLINNTLWTYGIETFKSEQSIEVAGLREITTADGNKSTIDISVSNGPEARLFGAYVQAEFEFGDVTIVPGVRYDDYELGGVYDLSFSKLSPKLSAAWQANKDLVITTGYGKIFKGPGLPETLMLNNDIRQADDVKAETGDHVELNINYDVSTVFGLDSAVLYTNLFQFTIDNSFHPTKNTDLSRSRTDLDNSGIEAGFNFSHKQLSGFINYSFNDAERDYGTYKSDDYYSGTHEVNLGLSYEVNAEIITGFNTALFSNADLTEREIDSSTGNTVANKIEKTGYGVTNIWLAYKPQMVVGLSVNLAIDNLFDKAYQNHKSFGLYWGNAEYNDNEVGRNIKATVSYQF